MYIMSSQTSRRERPPSIWNVNTSRRICIGDVRSRNDFSADRGVIGCLHHCLQYNRQAIQHHLQYNRQATQNHLQYNKQATQNHLQYNTAPPEVQQADHIEPPAVQHACQTAPPEVQQASHTEPYAVQQAGHTEPSAVQQAGHTRPPAVQQAGHTTPPAVQQAGHTATLSDPLNVGKATFLLPALLSEVSTQVLGAKLHAVTMCLMGCVGPVAARRGWTLLTPAEDDTTVLRKDGNSHPHTLRSHLT